MTGHSVEQLWLEDPRPDYHDLVGAESTSPALGPELWRVICGCGGTFEGATAEDAAALFTAHRPELASRSTEGGAA